MKFIDFLWYEDYGKEFFLNFIQKKRFCVFQFMLDFPEHSGSSGVIVSLGHSSLFGISFHILHFGFSLDLFTWKARQLDYWRHGLDFYLKNSESFEIPFEEASS